jgi:hypothetical protein
MYRREIEGQYWNILLISEIQYLNNTSEYSTQQGMLILEALVNAIVHRDYFEEGPVSLSGSMMTVLK